MSQAIQTAAGETFEIELEGNATTGFKWEYNPSPESSAMVELLGSTYQANTTRAGAPGVHHFRFRALKAGQASLLFRYSRPWEKAAPKETRSILIQIAPRP